ncbi:MFS transporter [Candidatus Desulfarcum epimagneticum]|uniref:MFS transporter n=1 Tax=uncultured Desulfobacteraceae bacterium TaxID=218296 RepID=A0A484HDX3_9BACT|nr:MFS transporter [uncultured Desulfobacteraceae bacterium]
MRRKDRMPPDDETMSIIEKGEYGILSAVSPSGDPHGTPLNYCVINGDIYFHCALEGEKLDHIANHPKVSFCVVGETEIQPEKFTTKYESGVVKGTAVEVTGEEKQMALEGLIKKYSPGFTREGLEYIRKAKGKTKVIRIVTESVTGKANR